MNEKSNDTEKEDMREGPVTINYACGHLVRAYIRREPSGAQAPSEFSLNVYVTDADGNSVDIVRIDTQADVDVHIDRFYLPHGDDERRHDPHIVNDDEPIVTPGDAYDWLLEDEKWKDMVQQYDENHGLPPTARDEL
jgi:hypothetical protein